MRRVPFKFPLAPNAANYSVQARYKLNYKYLLQYPYTNQSAEVKQPVSFSTFLGF